MPGRSPRKKRKAGKKQNRAALLFDFQPRFWHRNRVPGILVFLLAWALYSMSVSYGYVLDDQIVITDNSFTKKGFGGIWDILRTESFQGYFGEQKDLVAGARYRPLSIATFAAEAGIWGLNPHISHAINILLYALTGLLLFRVLSILFPGSTNKWYFSVAFLATVFFVAHPVHSEVVANIKGRDEIMALMGSLATLYGVLRFVHKGSLVWLGISAITMFLALLSKENAITMLGVIPVTLYFFSRHLRWKKYAMAWLPVLLATFVYLIIRYQVVGYLIGDNPQPTDLLNNPFVEMTSSQKWATILYTMGLYVRLLFIPHPLTHDYYPYHIPVMDWMQAGTLISAVLYLVLIGLVIVGTLKKRLYAYGILFFMMTIALTANILFPVGVFMSERFLFMPSVGFCVLLGYYLHPNLQGRGKRRAVAMVVAATCFFLFAIRTMTRVPVWKDALSLNRAGVRVSANSARANCFMATALYRVARDETDPERRKDLIQEARTFIDRSLSIYPTYYNGNQMKSGIVAEEFHFDRDLAKLLEGFREILVAKPTVQYIGQYLEYLNKLNLDKRALLDFYFDIGYRVMYTYHQRPDYALKYLSYGLSLDRNDPRINLAIGMAYQALGDQSRAQQFLQKANQLEPNLRLQ